MHNLLVVDDNKTNLQLVKQLLSAKYNVVPVLSGKMALHYLEKQKPDVILLDLLMPEMDGLATMKKVKEMPFGQDIPIIFLTADTDKETESICLSQGAYDFIKKPFVPDVMINRIEKALEFITLKQSINQKLTANTMQFLETTLQTYQSISNLIDSKDKYRKNHSIQVSKYARELAKRIGLEPRKIYDIQYASLVYDIGYIEVPKCIFEKPEKLSETEYETVKSHTILGEKILESITSVNNIKECARSHHEHYDGTGYPDQLKGENIPLAARIIHIADSYVALRNDRVYREKLSKEEAAKEIREGKGTQFDPHLCDVFLEMIEEEMEVEKEFAVPIDEYGYLSESLNAMNESNALLKKIVDEQSVLLAKSSCRDPLTELHNRKYLEMKISSYLGLEGNKGCFFILDIDGFKYINDTYGHLKGDHVLKRFATMLRENVREADLVCRLGGDEFVLFFINLTSEKAIKQKAKVLLQEYRKLTMEEEAMAGTSLSIGISSSDLDGHEYEQLYKKADQALYYVKEHGKNSYRLFSENNKRDKEADTAIIDVKNIMSLLNEQGYRKGAYKVTYSDFQRIYNFLSRCVERTKQQIQLLLLNIQNQEEANDISRLEEAVSILEQGIARSLRRTDVSTRYSSSQYILILLNTDENGADSVIQRIYDYYRKNNPYKEYKLAYDIAQIEP